MYATESALTHLIKQQILVLPLVHRTAQLAHYTFIPSLFSAGVWAFIIPGTCHGLGCPPKSLHCSPLTLLLCAPHGCSLPPLLSPSPPYPTWSCSSSSVFQDQVNDCCPSSTISVLSIPSHPSFSCYSTPSGALHQQIRQICFPLLLLYLSTALLL